MESKILLFKAEGDSNNFETYETLYNFINEYAKDNHLRIVDCKILNNMSNMSFLTAQVVLESIIPEISKAFNPIWEMEPESLSENEVDLKELGID